MSFNGNFPNQQVFKRFSIQEIHRLIVEKENQGWEMVKPVYKEQFIDKHFTATDRKRKRFKFSGDEEVIKYVAIMKRVRDVHETSKTVS